MNRTRLLLLHFLRHLPCEISIPQVSATDDEITAVSNSISNTGVYFTPSIANRSSDENLILFLQLLLVRLLLFYLRRVTPCSSGKKGRKGIKERLRAVTLLN